MSASTVAVLIDETVLICRTKEQVAVLVRYVHETNSSQYLECHANLKNVTGMTRLTPLKLLVKRTTLYGVAASHNNRKTQFRRSKHCWPSQRYDGVLARIKRCTLKAYLRTGYA